MRRWWQRETPSPCSRRNAVPGGSFRYAGKAPLFQEVEAGEQSFARYVADMAAACAGKGVVFRFGTDVTARPQLLAPFDRIVIASGADYRFGLGPLAKTVLDWGGGHWPGLSRLFSVPRLREWFYYQARRANGERFRRLVRPGQSVVVIGDAIAAGKSKPAIASAFEAALLAGGTATNVARSMQGLRAIRLSVVMAEIHFLLNGEPRAASGVSPTTTVLDWLRLNARLTGTKEGCAEGDCGACTVVVGRQAGGKLQYQAVNSCLMVLPQLDGAAVLTVDGLAAVDGTLHPVQQALIDADATQCGFCTPGFVMAMFAFHHGGEDAADARIHEALAGNLCRCTGYRSIVDACRRIAAGPSDRFGGASDKIAEALRTLPACTDYRHDGQTHLIPRTLDELHRATAEYPDALLHAGGTDLGLRVSKDREAFPLVISTASVAELQNVTADAGALSIGGAVTYSQALPLLDQHFPDFGALVRRIGSRQIRNLGTIAGNLATASPIGDTIPCLIALDASVTLTSRAGSRTMPVETFITGYRTTALVPGEVIAAIHIPFLKAGQTFAAYKLSKRFDQDISTVVAAFRLALDGKKVCDIRAAYGGMAARAMRAAHLEAALTGHDFTDGRDTEIDAAIARDFTPMGDHRGSAAYRLRAAANLVRRLQLETTSQVLTRVEAL